jgi:hypothetical protein
LKIADGDELNKNYPLLPPNDQQERVMLKKYITEMIFSAYLMPPAPEELDIAGLITTVGVLLPVGNKK